MNRNDAIDAMFEGWRVRLTCWQPGYWIEGRLGAFRDQAGAAVNLPSFNDGWEVVAKESEPSLAVPDVGSLAWAAKQCHEGHVVESTSTGDRYAANPFRPGEYLLSTYGGGDHRGYKNIYHNRHSLPSGHRWELVR